jgi:putative peptidoglycan lipid II flippase
VTVAIAAPPRSDSLRRALRSLLPLNVIVQACNFAALVAFAWVFGASADTDAYFVGLAVPLFAFGVLLSALRVGAIPALTEAAADSDAEFARTAGALLRAVLLASAAISGAVTVIAFIGAPLVLRNDSHFVMQTRLTMLELFPLGVFGAMIGTFGAVLAVRRRFVASVAAMAVDPILRVIFVLTLGTAIGVQAMIIGNLIGSAGVAFVLWRLVERDGVHIHVHGSHRAPYARAALAISAPLIISGTVLQINPIVDRTMATALGPGEVTAFELGLRLVPTAMFTALLIGPVTATWSARHQGGGWPALQASLTSALIAVIGFIPAIVVLGVILRGPLVSLFYDGGAYPAAAVHDSSLVFALLLLGLPAQVLAVLFATLFNVKKNTILPMKIAFWNVVLNILLNLLFRPLLGVAGIALSTSVTYTTLVIVFAVAARRRWGRLLLRIPIVVYVRSFLTAASAAALAIAVLALMPAEPTRLLSLAMLLACGGSAIAVNRALGISTRRAAEQNHLRPLSWRLRQGS